MWWRAGPPFTMDPDHRIIADAALAIRGDAIIAVGDRLLHTGPRQSRVTKSKEMRVAGSMKILQ